ncbi:MAG: hypothetical protein R3B99_09330 [Polyangiales bacterium]
MRGRRAAASAAAALGGRARLEALRLDRDAAVREERVVGWVDQVSDALREYLGRRYEFDGLESTTDEVVAELRKRKLIGLSLDEVIALLRDCDLVKFAKAPLGVEQSDLLLAGAFRVVRTTAPVGGMSAMGPVTPSAPTPAAPPRRLHRRRELDGPERSAVRGCPPGAPRGAEPEAAAPARFDPNAPWTPPGATQTAPAKPAPRGARGCRRNGAGPRPTAEPRLRRLLSRLRGAPAASRRAFPGATGWTPPPATKPLDAWAPPAPSTVEAWAPRLRELTAARPELRPSSTRALELGRRDRAGAAKPPRDPRDA